MALTEQTRTEAAELAGRYPQGRSALLPMLHLVQSAEGTVTPEGIALCADVLGLTNAEVAAVATFYTMYKRHRVGRYHVGVCTNTLCAVLGGDAIWSALTERLGVGHDEVTADGAISLERIECQAACTHAPVMTANWEFLDDMDVSRALEVVERLRAGEEVHSTRGPRIGTFEEIERVLAGFDDGLAGAEAKDATMLAGLTYAREHGMAAPEPPARSPLATEKTEG
ncbi:MAG: NADH-quinone oxidoreductase subunit NuoE [Frankiales bacterium]|nr:NADH-quinone oxidoreductase subunit NuoE [Frankiales bacterium]